jgi:small subunit ribosomal protein S2
MLTNWQTISQSIHRLKEMDEKLADENIGLTKKERLHLTRERDKLERALGGIKEMGGLPDVLFVIDTLKEAIAIKEARKLGLPVIAVVDSNSDPDGIPFPIPGNDDAMRAIELYCQLVSDAILDGLQQEMISSGADIGAAEEAPHEALPEGEGGEAAAARPRRGRRGESEGGRERSGRSKGRPGGRRGGGKAPAAGSTDDEAPAE